MPSFLKYSLTISLLLVSVPVSADQVKLYLDNTRTKHIMVEQQDC